MKRYAFISTKRPKLPRGGCDLSNAAAGDLDNYNGNHSVCAAVILGCVVKKLDKGVTRGRCGDTRYITKGETDCKHHYPT